MQYKVPEIKLAQGFPNFYYFQLNLFDIKYVFLWLSGRVLR